MNTADAITAINAGAKLAMDAKGYFYLVAPTFRKGARKLGSLTSNAVKDRLNLKLAETRYADGWHYYTQGN